MKRTITKWLAILVVIAMAGTMFAGCSGETKGKTDSTDSTASESNSQSGGEISQTNDEDVSVTGETLAPEQSDATTKRPDSSMTTTKKNQTVPTVEVPVFSNEKIVDLGGYEMTIATMWANEWESSKSNNGAAIRKFETIKKQIEKDYNAKINIKSVLPERMLDDITKASSAGDLYADVIQAGPIVYYNLVVQKMLTPINNLKDLNPDDTGWVKTYKKMTTYNGKFYGISWINNVSSAPLRKAMFFNKDLMAQYKQPNLYDLVSKGEWTWDKWETIMRDVASKSSNKVYGVGAYDHGSLALAMTSANNASMYSESGGKFSYTGDSANAVEAMEYVQKIVKDRLVAPDMEGFWVDTTLKRFTDGKALFYVHDYFAVTHINENMKQKYGVVPFPKGPKASNYSSHYGEGQFLSFMAGNKNQAKAAKLLFALAKRTNDTKWIDTQVKTLLCDKESGEMLKYLVNNPVVDCTPLLPQFGVTMLGTLKKIAKGEVGAKAGLANAKLTAQTNLNDFFKQK